MALRDNRKAYDRDAHAQFTALMERWGDTSVLAERQRTIQAVAAGVDAGRHKAPADAKGRNALRVAIRELAQQTGNSDIIDAWRTRFDRV